MNKRVAMVKDTPYSFLFVLHGWDFPFPYVQNVNHDIRIGAQLRGACACAWCGMGESLQVLIMHILSVS